MSKSNVWTTENGVMMELPAGWDFVDFVEAAYEVDDTVILSVGPKYLGRGAYSETEWNVTKIANPLADSDDDYEELGFESFEAKDWNDACQMALVIMKVGA